MVLVKDNHLDAARIGRRGGRAGPRALAGTLTVEVECDRSSTQVREAVAAGADIVMLDNMTPDEAADCVRSSGRATAPTRSSRSRAVSRSRTSPSTPRRVPTSSRPVAITQSAPALDIGLDLAPRAERPAGRRQVTGGFAGCHRRRRSLRSRPGMQVPCRRVSFRMVMASSGPHAALHRRRQHPDRHRAVRRHGARRPLAHRDRSPSAPPTSSR